MSRERLVWLLGVLVLAVGAWWLSVNTEWVDEERPRAAQGEAVNNPVYATTQLLRRLGMNVQRLEALGAMPPHQARLVLLSSDWELMPERAEQLRQWVLGGGHLVLMQKDDWEDTALAKWVPVDVVYVKAADRPKRSQPVPPAIASATPSRTDLTSTPPLWGDTDRITSCQGFDPAWFLRPRPGQAASWTLARADGTHDTQAVVARQDQALQALKAQDGKPARPAQSALQVLRMPLGQGSVTVLNTGGNLFFNGPALRCDNALLLAAALQAEPGATAWLYLHEKREALLPWLWHRGWIAIVIGALALAAALWRAAIRFGPRLAPAPRLRRSISEQVRGLGAYLQRGGSEALLAAQQRALDEAATRTLPRFARLPAGERARAVAAATGLAADELASAMTARFCTRAELPRRLQLLEAARRQLHSSTAKTSEGRHPPS